MKTSDPFVEIPPHPCLHLAWPTPNQALFTSPHQFFARTRANPDYGRAGWTRDCGQRLHKGCDIAPVHQESTGRTTTVTFTNCATGKEYTSREPTWIPHDSVFCLFDGQVDEAVDNPTTSDFGIHAVIRHAWPQAPNPFYSLYAHLSQIEVRVGEHIPAGHRLGIMGTSSRIPDAQNWLAVAPHLHLELWNSAKKAFNPETFLRTHLVP